MAVLPDTMVGPIKLRFYILRFYRLSSCVFVSALKESSCTQQISYSKNSRIFLFYKYAACSYPQPAARKVSFGFFSASSSLTFQPYLFSPVHP